MINKQILTATLLLYFAAANPVFSQEDGAEKKVEAENSKEISVKNNIETNNYLLKSDIKSPDELIGLSPEEAYKLLGVPDEIFSMRGEREWQDDVVFYYKNHIYLFWFKNRVWQFRADKRFDGSLLGIRQGISRNEVQTVLGEPFKSDEGTEIYLNPKNITRYETGFPVRMKIFYDADNKVTDIYTYRGDF